MGSPPQFSLKLVGAFRLLTPAGARVDISSRKGAALIAMLAMADDGERTRGWLQDQLWGARDPDQAQNSLRRELSNLRKALNAEAPLLVTDHDRVRLDLDRVAVDARAPASPGRRREFLEGLDIPGADGFEEWLREQRSILRDQVRTFSESEAEGEPPARVRTPVVDVSQPAPGFDGRPALAVLPFANLTGDSDTDYLAEGISEELIDRLSRLRWLPVIARSSSFSLGPDVDHRAVYRELGAKYLLEGRVRRAGEGFRLSASLTDAESGFVLWSPHLDLPAGCPPEALEPLVADLVAVLDTRIDNAEQVRAIAKPQAHLSDNELIWRGRWHLNRFTRADAEIARHLFAEALAKNPKSPEALIQATFSLAWSIWAERGADAEIVEMRKLAQRAIVADCDDGRAHMLAGIGEMWLRRPARAKTLLQRAISLNPSLAMAHAQLGGCHNLMGNPEAAFDSLKAAVRLSPNDMHLFYVLGELATAYCMLSRWADAVEHADQAILRRPAYWYSHMIKITALARGGDLAAANLAFDELLSVKPRFDPSYIDWLPFVERRWPDYFRESLALVKGDTDWPQAGRAAGERTTAAELFPPSP